MAQCDSMKTADINAVLRSIKDMSCLALYQSLDLEWMWETDLDDEIPSGRDVINGLSPENGLSRLEVQHIIGLMDDISTAHSYMSIAVAQLSSLGKLVDTKTFQMILHASI